jgi:glycosyltransferase involved in cell wall biosynthesis
MIKESKNILFYSPVKNLNLFGTQRFYRNDIDLLQSLGYEVILSNRVTDAFLIRRYDIAFIYFWTWGAFVGLIARSLGKKVIFTGGADDLEPELNTSKKKMKIRRIFFRICYFVSSQCLIVSKKDLSNMKIVLGSKITKLKYSPHQLKFEKYFLPEMKKSGDIITIAWMETIGNVKRKGLDRLLYFLKNYIQFAPNCCAYIVGTKGAGSDYLLRLVNELELAHHVKFMGNITENEKIALLNSNMFYWQVSEYEGFGLAALEALAARCIVIHSNRGGLADAIGNYGLQVTLDTPSDEIAKMVYEIYNSPEKREKLLENVGKHLQGFSFEKRAEDVLNAISD